ncbi:MULTISPECIES: phosphonate ABC transporter ATP-binding protein [Aerococcus]|uniref:phosphonate ABC transporter ATP-binding protein n=1 Tax=Aerococcus TaxID=1375 RepID=UPI000DCE32EC|nr:MULTISPECIES: phosphonate ABC transporter ATP-binding protein [Aerococcus]KAA9299052.1 phosphonate ABC transporter ATP-binding protein [Aerococcus tenax]MDK6688217.1 phosphonate ABC transporter ATP-binding protein [Aerococcus urinae]MDK8132664.1 phosphonate ABC transporter ATP-binding protein [Aerococcus urinae]MDK8484416.1 phosphonate ABC transporter ATP-binding protein [Aerococcus urinae]MDL5179301.1 phosphonate ABC transporter ATP-binding protein [Aerococcus tenax]
MTPVPLLDIKDLKKSYDGETLALNNINLSFYEKEFVVIIGPSGSGKSTFIRSINQLIQPTSGSIVFDGKELMGASKKKLQKIRSKIGMIFQDYNLIGRTNVLKNVLNGKLGQLSQWQTLFNRFSPEDVNKAVEYLKKVGLEGHIYKRANELSGGQQQRVGIARALMQDPKLLLADEPIASLDPKSSIVVMDTLKTLATEKGIACIVNLHQVDIAVKYATRIIGIRKGKVVFDDIPTKLTDEIIQNIYEGKEFEAIQTTTLGDRDE